MTDFIINHQNFLFFSVIFAYVFTFSLMIMNMQIRSLLLARRPESKL